MPKGSAKQSISEATEGVPIGTPDPKTFAPFEKITYPLDPLLYDADAEQTVPFIHTKGTKQGMRDFRVGHVFKPLKDVPFLEREQALYARTKKDAGGLFANAEPTEKLWSDTVIGRIGYPERADWKSKVEFEAKLTTIGQLTHVQLDPSLQTDGTESEIIIDEDELYTLFFHLFFGGIPLADWHTWLTSGTFPSNFEFSEAHYFDICDLVARGISPSALIRVSHSFGQETKAHLDEATELMFGVQAKNRLASAARRPDEPSPFERYVALYEELCLECTGYKSRVPIWVKGKVAKDFMEQKLIHVGKSVSG